VHASSRNGTKKPDSSVQGISFADCHQAPRRSQCADASGALAHESGAEKKPALSDLEAVMRRSQNPALVSTVSTIPEQGKAAQREDAFDGVICFSHLRWDFVYQRPQHIMSRFATRYPVWFIEEPTDVDNGPARLDMRRDATGPTVVVPRLCAGTALERDTIERQLIDRLVSEIGLKHYLLWLYTPMAVPCAPSLAPVAIIYDCMDELSAFRGAPASLALAERALLAKATVVFAGGRTLYEAKRHYHRHVHLFPSSVDVAHFRKAREALPEPEIQRAIPHPRVGFFGVVDERFDAVLLREAAAARPDVHFIVIGPVVKIDRSELPRCPNIHYLGKQNYRDLPAFLSHWQIAMMPFALNASTRFISPTKTPEYLAGGRLVLSTAIRDVVDKYGGSSAVKIAPAAANGTSVDSFVTALDEALEQSLDRPAVERAADVALSGMSWDDTFVQMHEVIVRSLDEPRGVHHAS
jgi:hypothetical protein